MKNKSFFSILILLLLLSGCTSRSNTSVPAEEVSKRIITTAPALTEVVFALGKGDCVVGNTKFCNFPEEAKKVPRVGGFIDVNLEMIISKKPDAIILYPENEKKLKTLKGRTELVVVKHTNLTDVFDSIGIIAKALKVEEKGNQLLAGIYQQLNTLKENARGKEKPNVLLIIGRNRDKLTNMYIIGKKDFLNQLMEIAGGVNAYQGDIDYPSISMESVVAMNPDVIIELSAFQEGIEDSEVFKLWEEYPFISAVKSHRITIIRDAVWLIPGPRVAEVAQKMQHIFYSK